MMVLVDTSLWSLALRRRRENLAPVQSRQVRILDELISEGRVQLIGPVRQEVLSGIRNEEQFARLRNELRAFPEVALDREDYERAAEISNACRAHGIIGSSVDFLICSVAARRNWSVYTADRDFERYSKFVPFSLYLYHEALPRRQ
jgi:predicted nucleic acid-binding protein